jgi:hypothetical protein
MNIVYLQRQAFAVRSSLGLSVLSRNYCAYRKIRTALLFLGGIAQGKYLHEVQRRNLIIVATASRQNDENVLWTNNVAPWRTCWFVDEGYLRNVRTHYLASILVHEARHVLQVSRFGWTGEGTRAMRETDACNAQIRFLKCIGDTQGAQNVKRAMNEKFWSDATTRTKRAHARKAYFDRLWEELRNHGVIG